MNKCPLQSFYVGSNLIIWILGNVLLKKIIDDITTVAADNQNTTNIHYSIPHLIFNMY